MKTTIYKNLALACVTASVLAACSSGGTCGSCAAPAGSKLIFVAPSILPSLANTTGVNYMGVYNPSSTAISGISYSLGQIVGSGGKVVLDSASAASCASIAAKSSCFLKLSVPESSIAGGAVVIASNSDGSEAATPLAIGVQQVPYAESANADGVGLYFYPKAQYSESGAPFMLATAVVQSPNAGNINTIELVDTSGNLITGQYVTSGNAGPGSAALNMGSVVEILVPLPQGVNLSESYKVRTSFQSASATLSLAQKLGLVDKQTKATTDQTTGTAVYNLTTQGNNINLQFTPNQVYLTQTNPIQYGYLYNIGDLTASQIQVSSSSANVQITTADQILNGQRVIKVTYELINTGVAPTTNIVTVSAQNPSGQIQTSTGETSQNIDPLPVPAPTPEAASYAYIIGSVGEDPKQIWQCEISTDGSFSSCAATPDDSSVSNANNLTFAKVGVQKYAYITSTGASALYYCKLNDQGNLIDCQADGAPLTDAGLDISQIFSATVTTVNSIPRIYLTNRDSSDGKVYTCTIKDDGSLDVCGNTGATTGLPSGAPYQVMPNPSALSFASLSGVLYTYIADSYGITTCQVASNGTFNNCHTSDPYAGGGISTVYSMTQYTFNSVPYLYLGVFKSVGQCAIPAASDPMVAANCLIPTNLITSPAPNGVAVTTIGSNVYGYVSSSRGVFLCSVDSTSGAFSSCNVTIAPDSVWGATDAVAIPNFN